MTDDTMLRDFLLDAAAAEFAAELNDTTSVDSSPRLRRQMTAMLSDPQGWVKRKRRPVWKRIARAAAVIVLTCALSLGALMAVSPAVRAGIINWRSNGMIPKSSIAFPARRRTIRGRICQNTR